MNLFSAHLLGADALSTARRSGFAKSAAPMYASSASVNHLKVFAISRYEPQICSATITNAIGTIINLIFSVSSVVKI